MINDYVNKIRNLLIVSADERTKEKVLRLTSGAKCIGVPVPAIRQIAKDWFPKLDFEILCEIADLFFQEECREEILFAIFVVAGQKKNLVNIDWKRINLWLNHLDNWETCDQLSSNIVTPIVVKKPDLLNELFTLTKSENKWKRRFAAATVANINHEGRAYPKETFWICKPLLNDKETVVTKAVAWAIREISKKYPEETFNFFFFFIGVISKTLLKECSELLPDKEQSLIRNL
jgi:3-methyladenine DNA glycosylase AlkD